MHNEYILVHRHSYNFGSRKKTALFIVQNSSPYDISKALTHTETPELEKFAIRCMGSFRRKCKANQPLDHTTLKSKRAIELYYQFRQAKSFRELALAFEACQPRFAPFSLGEDEANPSQSDADREELCNIQEHFESILNEIFSSTTVETKMIEELQVLIGETKSRLIADFMKIVSRYLSEGVSRREIFAAAFWVTRNADSHTPAPLPKDEIMRFIEEMEKDYNATKTNELKYLQKGTKDPQADLFTEEECKGWSEDDIFFSNQNNAIKDEVKPIKATFKWGAEF